MADNNELSNEFEATVTLTLDDGQELECGIVTIFQAAGKDYIALLPLEGKEAEDGEVFIYRYKEDASGEPTLENIETDEEYDIVADAFDEFLDSEEFDDLDDEE